MKYELEPERPATLTVAEAAQQLRISERRLRNAMQRHFECGLRSVWTETADGPLWEAQALQAFWHPVTMDTMGRRRQHREPVARKPVTPPPGLPTMLIPIGERLLALDLYRRRGPGVYFLCFGDDVIYIGQSVRPVARVGEHLYRYRFDRAFLLPCARAGLSRLEGSFIRAFRPRQNGNPGPVPRDARALVARFGWTMA